MPQLQATVWTAWPNPTAPLATLDPTQRLEDVTESIRTAHLTWATDSDLFRRRVSDEEMRNASRATAMMGYRFLAAAVRLTPAGLGRLKASVRIENQGAAPFYYDWPLSFQILRGGARQSSYRSSLDLRRLLPGDSVVAEAVIPAHDLAEGDTLSLRVDNALPSGLPVRFANAGQDADLAGSLSLCTVSSAPGRF